MQASRVTAAETAVLLDVQQAVNAVEVSRARVSYIEREHLPPRARSGTSSRRRIGPEPRRSSTSSTPSERSATRLRTYKRALYDHR